MLQRQNVNLPLIATCERFDRNKLLTALNHVLTDIDLAANLTRLTIVYRRFVCECFINQRTENTLTMLSMILLAVGHLVLNVLRHNWCRNDLTVRVWNAGTCSRSKVLEHQDILQPFIRCIKPSHTLLIHGEQIL